MRLVTGLNYLMSSEYYQVLRLRREIGNVILSILPRRLLQPNDNVKWEFNETHFTIIPSVTESIQAM